MITILDINALASIQDLGRYGLRRLGIGHAGAMDTLALKAGNLLLQNPENTPAIEIALGGMTIEFNRDVSFCIVGALYEATLDGQAIYSYWRYQARKGQVLQLIRAVQGMYSYLCVQGGFDVPEVLSSRSTDLKAGFGGFQGRNLKAGDVLPIIGSPHTLRNIGIAPIALTNHIHALPSSEYHSFSRKAQFRLWQNTWTLQSDSNRMGYRLKGDHLEQEQEMEMLSHAVHFGTIQVPPSGQPIILMADTQTTGGYPKIAAVVAADLGRLAQIRFGSKLHFHNVSPKEAQALFKRDTQYLHQVKMAAQAA